MIHRVELVFDASGAADAAARGRLVVIVDVIDMSTTLEAALEAGALAVYGASPDHTRAPVFLDPFRIGFTAGNFAREKKRDLIVVAEPRVGSSEERRRNASRALAGLKKAGCDHFCMVPNLGIETVRMASFQGKVVLAVTGSGGVAFDAAFNAGGKVVTATVARTYFMKGKEPALMGAKRALFLAWKEKREIAVAAASSNSLEDVLAAEYIAAYIQSAIDLGLTSSWILDTTPMFLS